MNSWVEWVKVERCGWLHLDWSCRRVWHLGWCGSIVGWYQQLTSQLADHMITPPQAGQLITKLITVNNTISLITSIEILTFLFRCVESWCSILTNVGFSYDLIGCNTGSPRYCTLMLLQVLSPFLIYIHTNMYAYTYCKPSLLVIFPVEIAGWGLCSLVWWRWVWLLAAIL